MAEPNILWVDQRHPEYEERRIRARYVEDHYTGAVLDKVLQAVEGVTDMHAFERDEESNRLVSAIINPAQLPYLIRRVQGESIQQYKERARISRFPRHFAHLVGQFTGRLLAVEPEADWEWVDDDGNGLGDPVDTDSTMYGYWKDADGKGTGWQAQSTTITEKATTEHRVW